MKRIFRFIPILVIALLLFGLTVIPSTQAEAAFESQVTTAGVAVVPDPAQIDIERGYVFSEPFRIEIVFDESGRAAGAGLDLIAITVPTLDLGGPPDNLMYLVQIDGIDPGGGILPLPLIDGTSGLTTSLEIMALGASDTVTTNNGGLAAFATTEIYLDDSGTPIGKFEVDENVPSSAMTLTTAPTTSTMKDKAGVFPMAMGFVASMLTIMFGFGLLLVDSVRRRAIFARIVVNTPRKLFGQSTHSRPHGAY